MDAHITNEGYIFEHEGKATKPILMRDFDSVTVAKELGILEPKEVFNAYLKAQHNFIEGELTVDQLKDILNLTIKHDDANKVITFLCELSAFTTDNQFNIAYRAETSTGKSYIPLEIVKLFPEDKVRTIAYSSPTAFFHTNGTYDEDTGEYIIDLQNKILIFVDMPHNQLLERLRPLLSHDEKELHVQITDKTGKGSIKTKHIKLVGYPSVIFCTAKLSADAQESSRTLVLSPEINEDKIKESILLKAKRSASNEFNEIIEQIPTRVLVKGRLKALADLAPVEVRIPNETQLAERFMNERTLRPRHSRDIERLFGLIKSLALLNYWKREQINEHTIIANETDIRNAWELWDSISEAQDLGVAPYILEVYRKVIEPIALEGTHRRDISKKFYQVYHRALPDRQLRETLLPILEATGLITIEQDPTDTRQQLILLNSSSITNQRKLSEGESNE